VHKDREKIYKIYLLMKQGHTFINYLYV
jgi:hypothetical protein